MTLNETNIANFDNVTNDGYQMCGCMTDYIMNSFIDPLYETGIFRYNGKIPLITTTWINTALLLSLEKGMTHYGWELGMPCSTVTRIIDPAPAVRVREDYGSAFLVRAAADILCKKHANSTEFS